MSAPKTTVISLRLPVALLRLVDTAAGKTEADNFSLRSRWIRNAMRRQLERDAEARGKPLPAGSNVL